MDPSYMKINNLLHLKVIKIKTYCIIIILLRTISLFKCEIYNLTSKLALEFGNLKIVSQKCKTF